MGRIKPVEIGCCIEHNFMMMFRRILVMKHLGIDVNVRHLPSLDPAFIPLGRFYEAFLKDAEEPVDVAVERVVEGPVLRDYYNST